MKSGGVLAAKITDIDRQQTQSGRFLCTAASSMPIRVVTREVRYIHELSLTLEHSMPISSPAIPV